MPLHQKLRPLSLLFMFALLAGGASPASDARASRSEGRASHLDDFGVMLMAHGGTAEWNQAVLDVVAPLENDFPVEVAF